MTGLNITSKCLGCRPPNSESRVNRRSGRPAVAATEVDEAEPRSRAPIDRGRISGASVYGNPLPRWSPCWSFSSDMKLLHVLSASSRRISSAKSCSWLHDRTVTCTAFLTMRAKRDGLHSNPAAGMSSIPQPRANLYALSLPINARSVSYGFRQLPFNLVAIHTPIELSCGCDSSIVHLSEIEDSQSKKLVLDAQTCSFQA